MDTITDQDLTDKYLDSFPLSEKELIQVLSLENWIRNNDKTTKQINSEVFNDNNGVVEALEATTLLPNNFLQSILKTAIPKSFSSTLSFSEQEHDTKDYLEAIVTCLGRRGPNALNHVVFSYCFEEYDTQQSWNVLATEKTAASTTIPTADILTRIHRIIIASHFLLTKTIPESNICVTTPLEWTQSLPESLTRQQYIQWTSDVMPFLYTSFSTIIHCLLFSQSHDTVRPDPFTLPQLDHPSQMWKNPWDIIPISLACHSSSLRGKWRRLYSSNHDGFSFRTFANALVSYKGPTIILIQTTSNDKIGFATDCPWKFSNHWYGDHADSFLFTMNPIAFYHPITGTGKAFQYLNLPPSYRNRDLRGLAIGGISQDCPRLHLTESMEDCIASAVDVTFENGPLLCDDLKSHFDVSLLEVFAVNATDVQYQHFRKHGEQELALQEAKRIQSAKVDKTQFIEDFLAGTVPNDLFGHRAHTSGRHEFHQNKDS